MPTSREASLTDLPANTAPIKQFFLGESCTCICSSKTKLTRANSDVARQWLLPAFFGNREYDFYSKLKGVTM
jgi:hypothetical protein